MNTFTVCCYAKQIPIIKLRAEEVTQVVERLPSKCEALSSNTSSAKQTNKKLPIFTVTIQ
jgi:hypothetical protein